MDEPSARQPGRRRRCRYWWAPLLLALAVAATHHALVYGRAAYAPVDSAALRIIGAPMLLGALAGMTTRNGSVILAAGFVTLALAWYAVFEALRCMVLRERRHRTRAYVLLSLAVLAWLWVGSANIHWNPD
jgi:hypothetical protein